ncbi:MAG: hypothetical protein E7472_01020 [Ruminococcaceae bacterium]|nr:hypothetical protein [Oscillospiraceae bacterium]
MQDRNIVYGSQNTIKWTDFSKFVFGTEIRDMSCLMNTEFIVRYDDGTEKRTIDPAYIARSIIKLHSLGVLQYDFVTTAGTTSPNFIDRLHVTFFGQKLLEYIDANNEVKGDP